MNKSKPAINSLANIKTGDSALIVQMNSGRSVVSRLTSLGFTPGARVDVFQNNGRGPLIIAVRGAHVALGRGEAQRIMVQRSNE